jgi:hypothetical protein
MVYDKREPRKTGTGIIDTALCKPLKIYFYCRYLKGLATDISFLKLSSSSTKDDLFFNIIIIWYTINPFSGLRLCII